MMHTTRHGKPLTAAPGRRKRKRINSFPIIILSKQLDKNNIWVYHSNTVSTLSLRVLTEYDMKKVLNYRKPYASKTDIPYDAFGLQM